MTPVPCLPAPTAPITSNGGIITSELREKMIREMQLRQLSERTQESYLFGVRSLAKYFMRPPDQLSDQQIQDFILYIIYKVLRGATARTLEALGLLSAAP